MIENIKLSTAELAHLFGTTPKTIAHLGKRGIIEKGEKRGTWLLQPSVSGTMQSTCASKQQPEAARKPYRPAHGLDKRKPL
jgi:hypothetical protein